MNRWLLPDAISDLLPAQAQALEEMRRAILDCYRGCGYELVVPPLIEYLDSLLIGSECEAHTFPSIESAHPSAHFEHEASTSRVSDDQMFYCRQRGLSTEDAVNLIVSGFCREVFRELPMEFAVEAQKLLSVSLEGSVG